VDEGTPIEAACKIIILQDQLEEALRINEKLRAAEQADGGNATTEPPAST
jgi:hypothetical protein